MFAANLDIFHDVIPPRVLHRLPVNSVGLPRFVARVRHLLILELFQEGMVNGSERQAFQKRSHQSVSHVTDSQIS